MASQLALLAFDSRLAGRGAGLVKYPPQFSKPAAGGAGPTSEWQPPPPRSTTRPMYLEKNPYIATAQKSA